MAPQRNALTLPLMLALATAACTMPAPGPAPVPTPTPADASPSVSPTAAPTAGPGEPTPPASAAPVETTTIQGRVYDDARDFVPDGTRVTVKSLDASAPYETTVETIQGSYVANLVPVGRQVEISATRDGWTRRSRVEVPRLNEARLESRNRFNFGGPKDDADPSGPSFFLSDYPEIERVEPKDADRSVSPERMRFQLVMSEPLDRENQRRLSAAFNLVPNNAEALEENAALPAQTATDAADLRDLRAGTSPATTAAYRYRQNAGFLDGAVVSEFTWDADGKTATFVLDAPVKTDDRDEAQYAFLLIQADDEDIVDADGKPLGMRDESNFGGAGRNNVIRFAVKESELVLAAGKDDPEERWSDTHKSFTTFHVAADRTAPKLVSVKGRRNFTDAAGAHDRIEMTFSEPMLAYPAIQGSQLLSLNNYILAASASQSELDAKTFKADGTSEDVAAGSDYLAMRTALKSGSGATLSSNSASMAGAGRDFKISVSPRDPKVVVLELPSGSLPLDADYVKVYAGSDANAVGGVGKAITDPAGNAVADGANQISGSID